MRVLPTALLLVALLPVAACAGPSDEPSEPSVNVTVPSADPGTQDGDSRKAGELLDLGTPADTVGTRFDGGGELEITPLSVVYTGQGGDVDAQNGVFAVVVIKDRNTGAVPAQESAPVEGGGWRWIAPEGEQVEEGNGAALDVKLGDFDGATEIQPGAFDLSTAIFDLKDKQRGGTLLYVDGENASYRWTMPTKDTGPQAADVKKQLAPPDTL